MSDTPERGRWSLKELMREYVGSGPNSADDMAREQAQEAFTRILAGEFHPVTLGAFLLANRWKRNTPEELAAFLDVMRTGSVIVQEPTSTPVDCGANYDGKVRSVLLGVAAGIVAGAAGTPVVTHSGDRIPTQRGTTYKHVLDALGVVTEISPSASAEMVDSTGFGFYYQPRFNPGVHGLLPEREQMGVRTVLNTIETLANPGNCRFHVGSFFHLSFAEKLTETIERSETVGFDRVLLFRGMEGYDDLVPGRTKGTNWEAGDADSVVIDTGDLGCSLDGDSLSTQDVQAESVKATESVLAGAASEELTDAVAVNAAVRLVVGGRVGELADGVGLARKTIADGDAASVLRSLREFQPNREHVIATE